MVFRLDRALHITAAVDRGFSLIEVLVATAVTTVAAVALAQVSLQAVRANRDARSITSATTLASRKMEQLRALTWAFDPSGVPVSDTSTDTAVTPEQPSGGTGLSPAPADALAQNRPGYCDFIDASGRTIGAGSAPPAGTAFIRRWSIVPLPFAPNDALVIQVTVTPIGVRAGRVVRDGRRLADETRILSVRSRKGG